MPDDAELPFAPHQMRLVRAILSRGGVAAGAAFLGISQPSASQQLRRIEDALGRRLFERASGGLKPNRNAEAYLVYAEAMRRVGEDARRFFAGAPAATLRLGVNEDFARSVLPEVLSLFSRDFPDFAYEVVSGLSTPLFARLDAGRLDVVVGKRPEGRSTGERVRREVFAWYGGADVDPPAAGPVRLAVFPEPSETRAVILDALRRAGREARVVFEASSLTAVEAAVRAGLGISAFSAISDTAGLRRLADAPDGIALPALGQVDLVIEWRPRPEGATAFAAAVREVLAAMERVGAVRPPGEAPVPLSGAP